MFNKLSHKQQQDVICIMNRLSKTVEDLRPTTEELITNSSYINHVELMRDMVSYIVFNNDGVTDDEEVDYTLPIITETFIFITSLMADYIKQGDMLPIECVSNIFILVNTSHEVDYYWQNVIKYNLNSMTNSMPDGKDVSTAIFKAVVNTTFDCIMTA